MIDSSDCDFSSHFDELVALFEEAEVKDDDHLNYFFDDKTREYWLGKKEVQLVKVGRRLEFNTECTREWMMRNTLDAYKKNYKKKQPTLTQLAVEGTEEVYNSGSTKYITKRKVVRKSRNNKFYISTHTVKGQRNITDYYLPLKK